MTFLIVDGLELAGATAPPLMAAILRPNGKNLQYFSLLLLSLQSSILTILMKYSRGTGGGPSYNPSSVVCSVELVKIVASFLLEMIINQQGSFRRTTSSLLADIIQGPYEVAKLVIPAFLYAIQNNLCYLALRHLSALNYQVIYQMKILTTAGFSVWLLGRSLTRKHWASLILLMIGVIIVQLSGSSVKGTLSTSKESSWFGFLILMFNSLSSGYAGVYFEHLSKIASKQCSNNRPKKTIWIQSIELGLIGLLFSFALAYFGREREDLLKNGFFHGYNNYTLATILLQSLGGILVAIVIRHADNIQKAFATSLSIVFSSFFTVGILGHGLPVELGVGTALVIIAIILYATAEVASKPRQRLPRSRRSSSVVLDSK